MRSLSFLSVLLLLSTFLLMATACPPPPPDDHDSAGDDDDSAGDDDDSAGDDDDSAAESVTLEITYAFDGWYHPVSTCEEAWIDELWVAISGEGEPEVRGPFPCDDSALLVEDLRPGTLVFNLQTVWDLDTWWQPFAASAPEEVSLDPAETTSTHVTMICDENNWEDGCGGA